MIVNRENSCTVINLDCMMDGSIVARSRTRGGIREAYERVNWAGRISGVICTSISTGHPRTKAT